MADLIDRQSAIDAVHKDFDNATFMTTDGWRIADQVEDVLLELPSAQPERTGHWIPVSERLPETADTYLVTRKEFGWNCEEYRTVDICFFSYNLWSKNGNIIENVVAWMPLPEPYKKGGETE